MNILDILGQAGGIEQIARETGIAPEQVERGAAALLPAILGGLKQQAQTHAGGLGGLMDMLSSMSGGGMLAGGARSGNVLGHIFGSSAVTDSVARHAETQTGIDLATIQRLLPYLAAAVAAYMLHRHGQSGNTQAEAGTSAGGVGTGLGSILGGMLSGAGTTAATGGMGGLGRMLDMDGDGNPLNDIIGLAGRMGVGGGSGRS